MDSKAVRLERIIEVEETFRKSLNAIIALQVRVTQKTLKNSLVARLHSGGLVLITDKNHNIRFGWVAMIESLTPGHSWIVERWNAEHPDHWVKSMPLSECLRLEALELEKHLEMCAEAKRKIGAA